MIECYCPHCYRDLRLPNSQGGAVVACTLCGGSFTAPAAPGSSHAASTRQVERKAGPIATPEPTIRCRCPHCNSILSVPASFAGKDRACPACCGNFVAPTESAAMPSHSGVRPLPMPVEAPPPDEPKIRCRCPHCNRTLRLPQALAGAISSCPVCHGQFTVPKEMAATASSQSSSPSPNWNAANYPRRKRRRRRRSHLYDDDYSSSRDGDYERGKIFALIIGFILLILTVINVVTLFAIGAEVNKGGQKVDPAMATAVVLVAGVIVILRTIATIGLMTGQEWGRLLLAVMLLLFGFCMIFNLARGNPWAIIDVLMNIGIGMTLLISPSIAKYTQS